MPWKWIPVKHLAVSKQQCFVLTSSHSDHNNRGHSSSASVCQSEERGETRREVSTHSVSTCYKRLIKPCSPFLTCRGEAAARPTADSCFKAYLVKYKRNSDLRPHDPHPPSCHILGQSPFFNQGLIGLLLKHIHSLLNMLALICLNYEIKIWLQPVDIMKLELKWISLSNGFSSRGCWVCPTLTPSLLPCHAVISAKTSFLGPIFRPNDF